MATVVLGAVGGAIGTAIGGPVGAYAGQALGAAAGAWIDGQLIAAMSPNETPTLRAPSLRDITITTSTEGVDVPRIYGSVKLGGNIIWATYHEVEVSTTSAGGGGKGLDGGSASSAGTTTEYLYYANFAVALCEGPVNRLGRCWADGEEISLTDYAASFYEGTEDQTPDPLIEAKEGAGNAPAYRGLAYVVFTRFPLKNYGNRVPRFEFEVFRSVDASDDLITAVTMIPAAGEYVYSPTEVRVDDGAGVSYSENLHVAGGASDFTASLDNLAGALPSVATVSLFAAWFGSDLRCGTCTIKPKVDDDDKAATTAWSAAGLTRATADVVSQHDGRVAYGGSPSDASLIAAIEEMHDRGLDVLFTPFVLMDIAEGNILTNPYTNAAGQPAYPWRGRITCSPAAGVTGTIDKTATAATQVDAFYGTVTAADFTVGSGTVSYSGPDEWTYSRFVLHMAALCAAAGGVEAFVIGSELIGLTTVRSDASTYPFVAKLQALAAQVAALLPSAQITYAADWSEYFGHQPSDGTGDVFFHLDLLWTDSNIDAVAIDNYWPLSDWRDGDAHTDYVDGWRSVYDLDYLQANIEGGEGYDWYYADASARDAQTRTAITDGAYNKPWVWRYKDVRSWWSNSHYNRPGGVQSSSPTSWTPQSKPIWFTELGCPAVDKGANQPNVFYDPKSAESALPYYSSGQRDDAMQRAYVHAFLEWYVVAANNPTSTVYGQPMVDTQRIMVYTWDARPYPSFPSLSTVWGDAGQWATGHWLNGRISVAPLGKLVDQLLDDYGFAEHDAAALQGQITGYCIDRISSARDALQPLSTAFFFDTLESGGLVAFRHRGAEGSRATLTTDDLVETQAGAQLYELVRGQEADLPLAAKVTYIDADDDYSQRTAEGRRNAGGAGRVATAQLPVAISYADARSIAETLVQEPWTARERAALTLPPSLMALEPGDMVTLSLADRDQALRLTGLTIGNALAAEAVSIEPQLYGAYVAPSRDVSGGGSTSYGTQALLLIDLPLITGDEVPYAGAVAAWSSPWPGSVALYRSPSTSGYTLNTLVTVPATMGVTVTDFEPGPVSRWDNGNTLRVRLYDGALYSYSDVLVLGGANAAAIRNADGEWEVIQFANATLVDTLTYDLTRLLRGQAGTESAMRSPVAAGAPFVLLTTAVKQVTMTQADTGLAYNWKYGPSQYAIDNAAYSTLLGRSFAGVGLRPLSPSHVSGAFSGGDLLLSWKRRTRIGGDSWEQTEVPLGEDAEAYEVDVMDGATVKRTLTVASAAATYTAAQQTADFGSAQSSYTVRVYQISASYGRGAVAEEVVP